MSDVTSYGVATLTDLRARLQLVLDAEQLCLEGQTVSVGDKSYTLSNLTELRNLANAYRREIAQREASALGAKSRGFKVAVLNKDW